MEEQRLDTELHMYLYWRLLASSVSRQHPELVNIQWVKVESRAKVNQMLCLMAFLLHRGLEQMAVFVQSVHVTVPFTITF